jgi:restriction endonuclease
MDTLYNTAMLHTMAMVHAMASQIQDRADPPEKEFESLLIDLFRRAGWRVRQQSPADGRVDLIVDSRDKKFVVELKRSAEGRRDRLVPLLSQAILQAQAAARHFSESAIPVAVVASRHIPESVAKQVKEFGLSHAPKVGIGVIDSEGFRAFYGYGLEKFNSERSAPSQLGLPAHSESSPYLFSDLNQWMMKILLGASIPESLLSVPRNEYRSGRQLAQAARVSVMSASRFIRHLSSQGFLDERKVSLRLVRIEGLMRRWLGASMRSAREIPVRWIIPGGKDQLLSAVHSYSSRVDAKPLRPRKSQAGRFAQSSPRICIGLFAAADLLGFKFVHGVAPHLYLERLDVDALKQLGLSVENAEGRPDVYIRIPENKEAVFRPVVRHQGVPVADILQVWLDVSNHPARGKEQADQIWKRVLAPSIRQEDG